MTKKNITEDQLDVLQLLHEDPKISQRRIAKKSGFSIGKVNYCLKALIDVGFVKIENFINSNQKLKYAYILTPEGVREKTKITKQFIAKKQEEFDKLTSYINK